MAKSSHLIRIAPGRATVATALRLGFTLGITPAGRASRARAATPAPPVPRHRRNRGRRFRPDRRMTFALSGPQPSPVVFNFQTRLDRRPNQRHFG